jgi:hypothetical protein
MIINNMMQWIDMFCHYETFGAKSLKTELQLKSYGVLKFYGPKCKFQGLDSK